MATITEIQTNAKNFEKISPFDYEDPSLEIATRLSLRDLFSFARISKHCLKVATNTRIWKPILNTSAICAVSNEPNFFKKWHQICSILFDKEVQVNEPLINGRFVWSDEKNILAASPLILSDEEFTMIVLDHNLNIVKSYKFLPSTHVECKDQLIFAVHPGNAPGVPANRKTGIQVYDLPSGQHITTLDSKIVPIDEIFISQDRIKITKLAKKT